MKRLLLIIGLILCLCSTIWGVCDSGSWRLAYNVNRLTYRCGPGSTCHHAYAYIGDYFARCPLTWQSGAYYYTNFNISASFANMCGGSTVPTCNWEGTTYSVNCMYDIRCSTSSEADSVQIERQCTSGTMNDSTIGGDTQWFCKNGTGLLFGFWDFSTNTHNSNIKYYINTPTGYEEIDEGTYNHLAAQVCTDVGLMRGVLNGKYVYWYSNEPEPTGVVNIVRIK